MASSSRHIRTAWPFALSWVRKTKPNSEKQWKVQEYLAGIAMMQVNHARREQNLSPFTQGMILIGIHESHSDPEPHMTIAAATDEMKYQRKHVRIHSRVMADDSDKPLYTGAECYTTLHDDSEAIRKSYQRPDYVTTSLMSDPKSTFAPVGCTVTDDGTRWYVLDEEQNMIFLNDEENKFYRVGEGRNERLAFFHPTLRAPYYAKFLGNERPVPHSPEQHATNLNSGFETAMAHLQITPETQSWEWVEPYADLGKDWTKPLYIRVDGQKIRTGWHHWHAIQRQNDFSYYYQYESDVTGKTYVANQLPAVVVSPWWKDQSRKPIRFNAGNTEFKTSSDRWLAGNDNSFYVYLQDKVFYMCYQLPAEAYE